MKKYLITYGADSDMATFMAESPAHAVEQFVSWAPVASDDEGNRNAIVGVGVVVDIPEERWNSEEQPTH